MKTRHARAIQEGGNENFHTKTFVQLNVSTIWAIFKLIYISIYIYTFDEQMPAKKQQLAVTARL